MHNEKCIKEAVITGPAGSGKSTLLARLAKTLVTPERRVLIIPEIATLVIGGGFGDIMWHAEHDRETYYHIQKTIFTVHDRWRRDAWELARRCREQQVLILHDRADMDQLVYVAADEFRRMRREEGKTLFDARDSYDAVFFLKSAAAAGKEFYTQKNNMSRREDADQSLAQSAPTLNAWIGHPHVRIIPSFPNVDDKFQRLLKAVLRLFDGKEIERKYLVPWDGVDMKALGYSVKAFIEQMYLVKTGRGQRIRIRKRWLDDSVTYYRTIKQQLSGGSSLERYEDESLITAVAYVALSALRDPKAVEIQKDRRYFAYHDQYFELDCFSKPFTGFLLLECELDAANDAVDLPPFIRIERDVTDDPAYTNYEIARRGYTISNQ